MQLPTLRLCALGLIAACAHAQRTHVHYRVTHLPEPAPGAWKIDVRVTGLQDSQRDVRLHVSNWGDWRSLDTPYFTDIVADPPLRPDTHDFEFDLPRRWNGELSLSYRISLQKHGSDEHRSHGLMPWQLSDLASGFAQNTMPRLEREDGSTIQARRTVELQPAEGYVVASGWSGVTRGKQTVELDRPLDQCLVMFGKDPFVATVQQGGRTHEVIQFGSGVKDITKAFATVTGQLLQSFEETFGRGLPKPTRVFITGENPGGGGGVRTDHGVAVNYNANPDSPHYRSTLAHELFHDWLPGVIEPLGPSRVWFFEGFTEYMSLWHAARSGVVDREWFAQRMLEIDRTARASRAFGKTSFTNDTVTWRDGDGPLEVLAYNGGALLALHLDVALRKQSKSSVAAMLHDFAAGDEPGYSLERLKEWTLERGAAEFFTNHIAGGKPFPKTRDALRELGFFRIDAERPGMLTFFGIQTDKGTQPGRITAIHEDSPKLTKNVRVGDVIRDYGPKRPRKVRVKPGLTTEHAFGLTLFDFTPGPNGWWLEIERDGRRQVVAIEPWGWRDCGIETRPVGDPDLLRQFFAN